MILRHLLLGCAFACAPVLSAQADARIAAHLEAFYKALDETKEYHLQVAVAYGNSPSPAPGQKGTVMRLGDSFRSDMLNKQMVLIKGHFLVIDPEERTIYHQTGSVKDPAKAAGMGWEQVRQEVRKAAATCRITASDKNTITLELPGREAGVAALELELGLKDHLPRRLIYRLSRPLEDGSERIVITYRFLPVDRVLLEKQFALEHYLRRRPDGIYEVSPAYRSYRLIEPDRS